MTMTEKSEHDVEVKDFPATLIAAMEHRGSPHQLGNTIRQFITWRKANQLPPSKSKTFNLIYDDPAITAPENFRFDIACSIEHPITSNDFNVVNKEIPAGKCAFVRHIGSDDTIGLVVDFLYSTWLPNSAYQLRDFPVFFERVSFFPEVPECEMITDVFLPIR